MKPLVGDCCKITLGNPDLLEPDTEATCDGCGRYWFVKSCEGSGSQWVCPAPGMVLPNGEAIELLEWGGNNTIGTAFEERKKQDDTAFQPGVGRGEVRDEPGSAPRGAGAGLH